MHYQKNLLRLDGKSSLKKITQLLFCLVFLLIPFSVIAQTVSFSVKNVSVKELLSKIEKESDVRFSYIDNTLDEKKDVTLSVKDESVEKVLSQVLGKKGLTYTRTGNTIAIKKVVVPSGQQQNKKTVTGVVTDASGEKIIGANVLVKGVKGVGTVTNIEGEFTLEVDNNTTLLISYIGYVTESIIVENKATISVVLREDMQMLDELVVVGYGVQKKVNLSGSISTVSKKTLKDRPVANVGLALQGAVANLNVSVASGQANSSPTFNIRGTTSINGGSPLIVIDGIVSSAEQLNSMNPSDIENVTVLKDASSAAIYGSRAAFGVILVTIKKGVSEKLTVNYNGNVSARRIGKRLDYIRDPAIVTEFKNKAGAPWYNFYDETLLAYAKEVSAGNESPYYLNTDGTYTYFGSTDWNDVIYKDISASTSHSIDISGKTDRVNYYFSGNYNFQDGMFRYGNDKYNKYNLRAKLDFKITDWWSISNNTSFTASDYSEAYELHSNSRGDGFYWQIALMNPLKVVNNPDGSWAGPNGQWAGFRWNHVAQLKDGGRYNTTKNNLQTQFSTKLDVFKDIFFIQANMAYSKSNNKEDGFSLPVSYKDGPEREVTMFNPISEANGWRYDSGYLMFDVYATFNKTFNEKHNVTVVAGYNQEQYRYDQVEFSRKELITSSLPSINLATGDINLNQDITTWALQGAFARAMYSYDSRYIMEFNGRYDGTSRFAKGSRWVFNPSGSAAWVVSNENFFEPIKDILSTFKIRYSYGSLGNQDVGTYAYLTMMGSGKISSIIDGNQPVGVYAPGLVPGDLTWEKVSTSNLGLDFGFLNNQLLFTIDGYIRNTKDMLTKGQTLPSVLGTAVPNSNAADLETKGWDLSIGWRDQVTVGGKPFNYSANFILSDSRAWITKFDNPTGTLDDYYVGMELGELWGVNTLGFFESQGDIDSHADQILVTSYPGTRPIEPGDLKFEDSNGDGKVDWGKWLTDDHGDYKVIGNTRSRLNFSFNGAMDWNGFDFSFLVQGVLKKDYYPTDNAFWGLYIGPWHNVTEGIYTDAWTEENPSQKAYFPRMKSYVAEGGSVEATLPQTRYLQNAAYARLKNVTFGYSLPESLLSNIGISRLRVYFSGENLAEISGLYKHYDVDPEGLGGQVYPFQRVFSFGVNLTF